MDLLLDTHTFLWFWWDDPKLSDTAREAIVDPNNRRPAMGRSFKSATSILDCLRNTKWNLFQGVSRLTDSRKTEAELLLQDVRSHLCTDELALAGGLASKLSDAESRAIELLTPPDPDPAVDPPLPPPPPRKGWKKVGAGSKSRLNHGDSIAEPKSLLQQLEKNSKLRLTVHWTLEEESE